MALRDLTEAQRRVVLQCMVAIRDGAFVEDWELHPRLGLHKGELEEVLADWPRVDDSVPDSKAYLAINNSMVVALNVHTVRDEEWSEWFDVSREEVRLTFRRWKHADGDLDGNTE